jgi:hypothetical protein
LNGDASGESFFFADPLDAAESDPKVRPDAPLWVDEGLSVIDPGFIPVIPAEEPFELLFAAEADPCAPELSSSLDPVFRSSDGPVLPLFPESGFALENGGFPLRLWPVCRGLK